jgi:hypothetical protein
VSRRPAFDDANGEDVGALQRLVDLATTQRAMH